MADEFKIRIEMRQIGVRQEAQLMGGIGSCGRELCCSTWLNDFRSVSTSAARYQQLSLNPQKLAGQCGKLKCCLNYELDMYVEAIKDFPESNVKLKTKKGDAFMQKMDIFRRKLWYSYISEPSHFIELNLDKVQEVLAQNKQGKYPESLEMFIQAYVEEPKHDYENVVGQDSITRFDKNSPSKRSNKKRHSKNKKTNNSKGRAQGNQKPESKRGEKNPNAKASTTNAKQQGSAKSKSKLRGQGKGLKSNKNFVNRSKENGKNKSE